MRWLLVQESARERTWAGFLRVELSVHDPTSLAGSLRLLFSVTAFVFVGRIMPRKPIFVKLRRIDAHASIACLRRCGPLYPRAILCCIASNRITAVATAVFNDSTPAAIGMVTCPLASALACSPAPLASPPTMRATGRVQSAAV